MRAPAGLAFGLLAACALAACGSTPSTGASSSSPSPAASVAAAKPGCDLVPGSLVTGKLGITVGDPKVTATTLVTTCMYTVGANPSGVVIRFQTHEDHAGFVNGKSKFLSTSDVSGVGDEAYTAVLANYTTLVARKGAVEIEVTSKATLGAEKDLMLTVLAKV